MKILVSTTLLSPYRVDWLNELGKYAEVLILYLNETNSERNDEWLAKRPENCTYRLMRGKVYPKVGKISYDFINEVENHHSYDVIILDGYGYGTQLLNIEYLNKKKIRYYVNVDGIVPNKQDSWLTAKFKRRIISSIPYFLCGSKETANILVHYGSNYERIIHHPFTSLYKSDIFHEVNSDRDKAALRKKLNILEDRMIISVGRFSYMNGYGKGYDVILRAAAKLKKKNIGWYVIGGKPTEEFEKMLIDMQLNNVYFIDFKPKEELKEYYRASDLFVLMTVADVWGLVINEAMACGLPVITTDMCVAGVELIENGKNGYVIPVGDDNMLAMYADNILFDAKKIITMGNASINRIQEYTIENMAKVHISAFRKALGDTE